MGKCPKAILVSRCAKTDREDTNWAGVVMKMTTEKVKDDEGEGMGMDDKGDAEEESEEMNVAEEVGQFNKFTVWRHEELAEPTEDKYLRGVDEWIAMADAVGLASGTILQGH